MSYLVACDYCGAELSEGRVCLECVQVFCSKCSHDEKCTVCGNDFVSVRVEQQNHAGNVIQWIWYGQSRKLGLALEFGEIPRIAYSILKLHIPTSSDYDIVLFPTKKHSRKFLRKLLKNAPKETLVVGGDPEEKPPDRSRYTVVKLHEQEKFSVFLNVAAIQESSVAFLIAFLNGFFLHSKTLSLENQKIMKSIAEVIFKSIRHYNSKFGIKFLVAGEFTRLMANNLLFKMWCSYAERLSLKELARDPSVSKDVSAYTSHKISAIFDLIRNAKFFSLTDLVNLAGAHADALNIVFSLSENPRLFQLAMNKFQTEKKHILARLVRHRDVASALESFVRKMSKEEAHQDYEVFASETCRNLTKFLFSLKPTYVWLEETYSLAMATTSYLKQIEENLEPYHPQFGNVDDFLKFLSRVFKKIDRYPELYPEIPLIAGYLLLHLLEYLAEWRRRPCFLYRALKVGQKLATSMDKAFSEIRQKNPSSPFRSNDIATIYTGLAMASMKFGKKIEMVHMLNQAKTVAEKYDLPEIKCLVNWHEFILNQDYDKLLQVHNLYSSVPSEFARFKPQFKAIACLSRAVFEKKDKFPQYQKAIESSMELAFEMSLLDKTSTFHDLIEGRIMYYVANLFLKLEEATNQEDASKTMAILKEATVYANALEAEIGAHFDPAWVFVLKTKIVDYLANEKIEDVNRQTRQLERFSDVSVTTRDFLNMARMWRLANKRRDWTALLDTLDMPYENRDPWSILLAKIIESRSRKQLGEKLELFPKAALFVEGPTEEVVIPILAAKMGIDLRELGVGVVPLCGSSKSKYHLRLWKEVMGRVSVSRYLLVDSHASEEAEAAMKEKLVDRSKCFVLRRGSIEDYYPDEVLFDVVQELCGKRPTQRDFAGSRVAAINAFLKKNGYTADWKIIVGKRTAERMRSDQLPSELEQILRKISSSA